MLLNTIKFAYSFAFKFCKLKVLLSFALHFIMAISTVLGIALVSLAARLTINDDTEFVVRALKLPENLLNGESVYYIFGLGFLMLMIAVVFSFLGRRAALDVESDVSAHLTSSMQEAISKYNGLYRVYLSRKEMDMADTKRAVSSGVRIVGSIVRIGLYQSANIVFLLLTSIILMSYTISVAFSLIFVTALFLFLLYKRSQKAGELETSLKKTKISVSENSKRIIDEAFSPNSASSKPQTTKTSWVDYKKLDKDLGRTIGILDSSRLVFGGLLSAYFVCLIMYIFVFGKNEEILFPIIFLVIVVRQYAVSATAIGVYLVAVGRLSGQIQNVATFFSSIDKVNNKVMEETSQSNFKASVDTSRMDAKNGHLFCFSNDANTDVWLMRIASYLEIDSYLEFSAFEKEFATQAEILSSKNPLNEQANMYVRKALAELKWPLPKNFSLGLAVENKDFKPVYLRSQSLWLARIFNCKQASSIGCIILEARQFMQLRSDVKKYLSSTLKIPLVIFGSWSDRYLDLPEFEGGYYFSEDFQHTFIRREELYRMEPDDIKALYRRPDAEDMPIIDAIGF